KKLIRPPQKLPKEEGKEPLFVLPTRALLPLGIIAFCGMTGEGAMADWSAIFMHEVVGQPKTFGAIAVGAFSVAMTLGRLFGDALIQAWGKGRVLKVSSILSVIGLLGIVGLAATWSSLIGFFAVGLGLANVVPIIYSTAGNAPGVEPSVGIAMATTIGYSGFFVGPPVIGFLGDAFGLRLGLVLPLGLFLIMWWLVQRNPWQS
ncbi:MAG: MFS transporter, partial [Bacteroidota bacterium]